MAKILAVLSSGYKWKEIQRDKKKPMAIWG
jgi:hypothetical protein